MPEGTFQACKAKYSGMSVSKAKRLKALEEENGKLPCAASITKV